MSSRKSSPSPREDGGLRKRQAAATEAALKAAARRVFARVGYVNAKITDITSEAGRAAGSFYNHFPSKEALLEALAADVFDEGRDRATSAEEHGEDLSDAAQLRAHVAATWHTFKAHLPEITAMREASLVNERLARRVATMRDAKVGIMARHLERMRSSGTALPGQPDLVASAVVSMLEQFCQVWLLDGGDAGRPRALSDDEAIDTLTGLILGGISKGGSMSR